MTKYTRNSVAIALLIVTTLSSLGAENQTAPASSSRERATASTAATVVTRKVGLSEAEFAKYRQQAVQAQPLANHAAAGAKWSKDTGIVVGVVVVVGIVVIVATVGHTGFLN